MEERQDLISRQSAIDALGERPIVWSNDDEYALGERNQYDIDRLAIETVPSAQPEPCEDAVSKEAVSSWLKQYGQDVLHGKYKFSLMYIWKKLMDLPPVTPKQRWIPVGERLPEKNGQYLVTVGSPYQPIRVYDFNPWDMDEDRKYWRNDCDDHSHVFNWFVKAWMPLPEPFREEGGD